MSKLFSLSNAFLKSIESNLKTIYLQYIRDKTRYKELIQRLVHIRSQIDDANISARIDYLIARLNRLPTAKKNIVEVYKDEKLVGILCDNIEKPCIEFIRDEREIICTHEKQFDNYKCDFKQNIEDINIHNDIEEFNNIEGPVLISLYTHDYRTFAGFTCILLISTQQKTFAIDTLNVRDIRHVLFHCGNMKYFHCQKCLNSFKREFGNVGCFKTLNLETEIYVDWRIRPLNNVMKDILKEDAKKMAQAVAKNDEPEETITSKIVSTYDYTLFADENNNIGDLTKLFLEFYGIDFNNFDPAYSILKLRNFIAKSNNESPWYVLTDKQVITLILKKPETQESFQLVMERTSPLAREHISDIVLIFRNLDSHKTAPIVSPILFEKEDKEDIEDEDSKFTMSTDEEN